MLRDRKLKSKEESKWVKQNGKATKYQESSIVLSIGTDRENTSRSGIFKLYTIRLRNSVFKYTIYRFPIHSDFI